MTKDRYCLTVTLNPAVDHTLYLNKLETGRTKYYCRHYHSAGGKGLNVSRVLNILGVNTLATGFIGGHTGNFIKEYLGSEKIHNRFIAISEPSRSNLTLFDTKSQKETRLLGAGPTISAKDIKRFISLYLILLKKAKMVVLSGRLPGELPNDFYAQMIQLAHKYKVPVFLDTSGKPLKLALKARPDFIKPNLDELNGIVQNKIKSNKDIAGAIKYLHSNGIKYVMVSLGSKGAIISHNGNALLGQGIGLRIINSVGCGDSFIAGFISSYFKGEDLAQNLRKAIACGSANTQVPIPGLIEQNKINSYFKKIKTKSFYK